MPDTHTARMELHQRVLSSEPQLQPDDTLPTLFFRPLAYYRQLLESRLLEQKEQTERLPISPTQELEPSAAAMPPAEQKTASTVAALTPQLADDAKEARLMLRNYTLTVCLWYFILFPPLVLLRVEAFPLHRCPTWTSTPLQRCTRCT